MRIFALVLFCLWAVPVMAVGVDSQVLEDPAEEAKAQDIMAQLRCLVCQNQSIVDSDAPLAADLRQIVRERVALGEQAEAVKRYLVERYGDWVLLNPPVKRTTWLLWFSPLGVFALAVVIIIAARRSKQAAALSDAELTAADKLLKDGLP